jgi:hypothetical protein
MLIPSQASLKEITTRKTVPLTTAWSRLEGRPRSNNFDRALKAEVRDALWMLAKQWQMGEFQAEDAGSPVVAKICTAVSHLQTYQAGNNAVQKFDNDIPFEAKVEQRAFPFSTLQQDLSLDLRLIMGRRWTQLLKEAGLWNTTKSFFLDHYGFKNPDPTNEADALICAHPEVWQQYAAVAGRVIDGGKLFLELKANKLPHYYDRVDFPLTTDHDKFDKAETKFKDWFTDLFYQPDDPVNNAWASSHLEYQFSISTNDGVSQKRMHAEEYYQGHLDWYNLDVDKKTTNAGEMNDAPVIAPRKTVQSIIPAPVMFEGMPNTRWWAFEDSRVNYSYIKPDTTDLPKLIMMEFGLIYANDWYLIPYKIPVASLTKIKGLTLTNSFGENFWIDAAGKGDDNDWTRWNMFSMMVDSDIPSPADTDLLLLPTVAKIQEGQPVEEVMFVRDEMANMVWAIETVVPLASGFSKSGFEAAAEYHSYLQKLINDSVLIVSPIVPIKDGDEEANIRYEIMNSIPENWIPFIPAHVKGSNRETQLQRAAMPRILEADTAKPDKIRPRSSLLQEGLKDHKAYFIHEEEVPRSGVIVEQSYQRTRWNNGKVFVWFGVRKTTGRGEGSSGLGFDRIVGRKKM